MRHALPIALVLALGLTPLAAATCPYPAQECLDELAKMRNRGYAGVDLDSEAAAGWTVTQVQAGTPAASAGIRVGDVLLTIGGVRLGDEQDMPRLRDIMTPGNKVEFTILRDGKEKTFRLELIRMPDDVFERFVGEHMLQHTTAAARAPDPD